MRFSPEQKSSLEKALESIYRVYNRRSFAGTDPVGFLHRYRDHRDIEVAGIISSSLAIGNVKQINRSIASVLGRMGDSPSRFLLRSRRDGLAAAFDGFRHRWIGGQELGRLLSGVKGALERYGSLEQCFAAGMNGGDTDVVPALTRFVEGLSRGGGAPGRGLLASPCRNSACKRLNLFLRWMVRNDEIDPGVWKGIEPSKLVVPLDTHMFRIASALGMTDRRTPNLAAAQEITSSFAEIAPKDPVKYDFALTRLGILGGGGATGTFTQLVERVAV